MQNFNRKGYSTTEVAQMLGVTPCTVRSYINSGKLKANVSKVNTYRSITIERWQLLNFLEANNRFKDTDLVMALRKACAGETVRVDDKPQDIKATIKKLEAEKMASKVEASEYEAHNLSELTGAWAGLAGEVKKEEKAPETKTANWCGEEKTKLITESKESCRLLIDGRISLANVSKKTVVTIGNALSEDKNFKAKSITIEF